MAKQKSKTPAAEFQIGDEVRVRRGMMDTDYPDMPLGGWAGVITDVNNKGTYTVQWSEATLASIHPVFEKRCEKDGLESDQYCLGANDLEPDAGGPLEIEQPEKITTKPLSVKDQDDRIRMVFGLTSNDPLPDVDDGTLESYHEYLSKNLAFPFTAKHAAKYSQPTRVTVIGLSDSGDEPMFDEMYGVYCEARREREVITVPIGLLKNAEGQPNRQLIDDHSYWVNNWC